MTVRILIGDAREKLAELPDKSVHCCVTSPPYFGLRDYGVDGQIGLEATPDEYAAEMVGVFREVWRVLRDDATLWLNIGDSYAGSGKGGNPPDSPHQKQATNVGAIVRGKRIERGSGRWGGGNLPSFDGIKPKDLIGIPWLLAFALRADGWYLRSEITWVKRSMMPESVTDRPTNSTESIFLLTKSPRYFYDEIAVREPAGDWGTRDRAGQTAFTEGLMPNGQPHKGCTDGNFAERGRNMRNWWLLTPEPYPGAHFATFPTEVPRRAILAGTSDRGVCPKCRSPLVRQTQTSRVFESGSGRAGNLPDGKNGPSLQGGGETLDVRRGPVTLTRTVGWKPTCRCDAGDPIPATVLDCFGGSGTTGAVADQLGRDAVLIELNPKYAAMAAKRAREPGFAFYPQTARQEPSVQTSFLDEPA